MYPSQPGLVIAMPLTGRSLPPQVMFCYSQLAPPMNYNVQYIHTGPDPAHVLPVDQARCFFAKHSIAVGARYLFMMDEDVAVPAHTIRQMIFYMEHHPDWAVVGGIYCQKDDHGNTAPMVFRGKGTGPYWNWKAGELFEVDGISMGCTLIRVEALKDLEEPYFLTVDDNTPTLDAVNRGDMWTEDLYFCNKLLGTKKWKIFADGGIIADHLDINSGRPYNLPANSFPVQHLAAQKGKKKILDIGCGENKYETDEGITISADIRENVHPDYRCDIRRLPFGTGQFDIVFSSHVLEHFGRNEYFEVLKEWVRVLKPDGELRLVIPSIAWAAEQIMKGVVDFNVLNVLYGQQEYAENFHKMGFTPQFLEGKVRDLGFNNVSIELQGYNILLRANRTHSKKKQQTHKTKIKANLKAGDRATKVNHYRTAFSVQGPSK
jgi:predicted SAM-dependent methyltransferase